jgi:hypothetical protein
VDEDAVLKSHEKVYKEDNPKGLDAKSLGGAAALQVSFLIVAKDAL